jgi:hypothetical protein
VDIVDVAPEVPIGVSVVVPVEVLIKVLVEVLAQVLAEGLAEVLAEVVIEELAEGLAEEPVDAVGEVVAPELVVEGSMVLPKGWNWGRGAASRGGRGNIYVIKNAHPAYTHALVQRWIELAVNRRDHDVQWIDSEINPLETERQVDQLLARDSVESVPKFVSYERCAFAVYSRSDRPVRTRRSILVIG